MRIPFLRAIKQTTLNYLAIKQQQKQLAEEHWVFSDFRKQVIRNEEQDWLDSYLPISLKNKKVLDVGAGQAETARFFLQHGAAKVYCIEINPKDYAFLEQNAANHKQLDVYLKPFELSDLKLPGIDFLKIDIEGYEEKLLQTKLTFPAVAEVHGLPLVERFRVAGWRISTGNIDDPKTLAGCTKYAYWMC